MLGPRIAQVLTAYGNTSRAEAEQIGVVVQMFALGLVPFTVFYLCLRGYYAFEDTRTPFWLNVGLNVLNAGFALALFFLVPTSFKVPALALGYSLAYLVTAVVTWRRLGRRLGGLETHAHGAHAGPARPRIRRRLPAGVRLRRGADRPARQAPTWRPSSRSWPACSWVGSCSSGSPSGCV